MKYQNEPLADLIAGLLLLFLVASLAGCAPTRARCERNYGQCGQTLTERITTYRDTTIYLPGGEIYTEVPYPVFNVRTDTLKQMDTVTLVDDRARVMLRYWRTRADSLAIQCSATPDTVTVTHTVITEKTRTPATTGKHPGFWIGLAGLIISGLFAILILYRIVKPG